MADAYADGCAGGGDVRWQVPQRDELSPRWSGVSTPVWFVRDGQRLLIETDIDSFKVKRMRREPRVAIARCTMRGKIRELPTPGESEFLPDDQVRKVERLMAHKYRVEVLIFRPIRAIQRALHVGRYRGKPVIVAITPAAEVT